MATHLVVDFGNTQGKLAVFSNDTLGSFERFAHLDAQAVIARVLAAHPKIEAAIVSSVINHPAAIESLIKEHCPLVVLSPTTPLPITNSYATPQTLGRDRLAAAVAMHSLHPNKPGLSIDCGTCITFDLITADGCYRGGAISPGLEMRFKALHTFTEHLPLIPRAHQAALVGNTTEHSILSGVTNGVVAEMAGIINAYHTQYPGLVVVLTGGDCSFFEKALKNPIFADPKLVLKGLNSILTFNDRKD